MKLTIAIGTYNRPDYIQRQVRDLLPQILNKDVRLVVFDNCSTVPVKSLFEEVELKQFEIYRNKVNIGRDQNQVRCIESAEEGWVWTLSDDDKIKANAVDVALDLISQNSDCCYINTGNKRKQRVNSLNELLNYFKIYGTFGISFFQSECLYNVDKIGGSLRFFNEFLSSQIGQICMVIKHMESTPEESCQFYTQSLLDRVNPGGWDSLQLISNTSILFEKFHYNRKLFRNTLFKALCDFDFSILTANKHNISHSLYLLCLIRRKMGLYNLLRYNYLSLAGWALHCFVPQKFYSYIRRRVASRYNSNI